MEKQMEDAKKKQLEDTRFRNISHNVRCTECGSQSIEDSQADIAILLKRLIRNEIRAGKSDKEIFVKLEQDFGDSVLYTPTFDMYTAALWLSPAIFGGIGVGFWAYKRYKAKNDAYGMARTLLRFVPSNLKEDLIMMDILVPPPRQRSPLLSLLSKLRR